jgi:hypothetical protein
VTYVGPLGLRLEQHLVSGRNTLKGSYGVLKKKKNQGPLAGCFPLVSLRTIKADVVVGVDKAVAERLDKNEERWRFSGR